MVEKTVAGPTAKRGGAAGAATEATRARDYYAVPAVDIYESRDELVLLADLPGVSQNDLNVGVEGGVLTIQADARHVATAEPVYREYELAGFFRQFELSEEVNQEGIVAEFKHGVLTLRLPKVEKAKPRRIEMKVV